MKAELGQINKQSLQLLPLTRDSCLPDKLKLLREHFQLIAVRLNLEVIVGSTLRNLKAGTYEVR